MNIVGLLSFLESQKWSTLIEYDGEVLNLDGGWNKQKPATLEKF